MDAIYLICIEVNEHILRKACRLSYRFGFVKIIASPGYVSRDVGARNIQALEIPEDFRAKFQGLECNKFSLNFDYIGRGDLSEKRTLAIQDAVRNRYRHILIIDDDIWPIPETHRRKFIESGCDVGGQPPLVQPDLSAIERCDKSQHTYHETINGNYLYLKMDRRYPFFPRIYNEDWIFLHFAVCAKTRIIFDSKNRVFQSRRTIRNSYRAYYEEFGEFIVDFLQASKNTSMRASRNIADELYSNRRSYLARLGETATDTECVRSVEAALRALSAFDPSFAIDYIEVVRAEMAEWSYT